MYTFIEIVHNLKIFIPKEKVLYHSHGFRNSILVVDNLILCCQNQPGYENKVEYVHFTRCISSSVNL